MIFKYIEFLDAFKEIVLNDSKQKTTRLITTDHFCYYSEFMYCNHRFVIDSVERKSVSDACTTHYSEEMFATASDMYDVLKSIYKDKCNDEAQCFIISFHRVY